MTTTNIITVISPGSSFDPPFPMRQQHISGRPVIIFDWDDTLLASSDLSCYGYGVEAQAYLSPTVQLELKALEASVYALLRLAVESGTVLIVTNSESGWVQLSAQRFLPSVLSLLGNITVISARSAFERQFPNSPADWKVQAFRALNDTFSGRTVLSFGDSYVDRDALFAATSMLKKVSVKFLERPSLSQLCCQIDLVRQAQTWSYLCQPESDLDLVLILTN